MAELVDKKHQAYKSAANKAQKKKKKAERGEEDEESSESDPRVLVQPEDIILRRGQLNFSDWSIKLCLEIMALEDNVVDMTSLKLLNRRSLHQIMEYIFDSNLHGDAKDNVGTASTHNYVSA